MNFEDFKINNSINENNLVLKLDESVELDEIAIKVLKNDIPEFIVPFSVVDINGHTNIKYKTANGTALEYCLSSMTKTVFLGLYRKLILPFTIGNNWFLNIRNFCLDPRCIYFSKDFQEVFYLYIPQKDSINTDDDILKFFNGILNRVQISDDSTVLVGLYQFFGRGTGTLKELDSMVEMEEEKVNPRSFAPNLSLQQSMPAQSYVQPQQPINSSVNIVTDNTTTSNSATQKASNISDKEVSKPSEKKSEPSKSFASAGGDDAIMDALFGNNKKSKGEKKPKPEKKEKSGGLFKKKETATTRADSPVTADASVPNPAPLNNQQNNFVAPQPIFMPDGDKTITEDEISEASNVSRLDFISSDIPGAPNVINLDNAKGYIDIGRQSSDPVQPDVVFPKNFGSIGRRHIRIQNQNGKYLVIDLGSANHTFLNGQQLVPNVPVELSNGDELAFTQSHPVKYRVII